MKLSIIIPAFNEEKTLEEVVKQVVRVNLECDKEVIIINDGSTDKTGRIADQLKSELKNLIVIHHKINLGKGAAVGSGIKRATGDTLLIQDADFEYNPSDIPRLIDPILKGKEQVVYGVRLSVKNPVVFGKNRTPLLAHAFGNKFLSFVTSILYGQRIADMETGYKVLKKNVLHNISLHSRSFDFEPEITAKILKRGIKIKEIDIKTKPRTYDEGKKLYAYRDGPIALWTLLKYRFNE